MLTTRATLPLLAFAFMVAVGMPTTLAKGEASYRAEGRLAVEMTLPSLLRGVLWYEEY
jgi:hypothetical protein